MKRQGDRDSPARSKRNRGRSPFGRRSYRDNNSPDYHDVRHSSRDARRTIIQNRRRNSPVSPPRYSPTYDYNRSNRGGYREQEDLYNTLVVSNFSAQVGRDDIEESLFYEFRKFGEVVVKVTRDYNGERIAYATFRSSDDAKECKNAKGHLVMHDRRLNIEIANDYEPTSRMVSPRERTPPQRELGYSPIRRRSPAMNKPSPPRRRSPKRISGRGRSPARERVPLRDRNQYRERMSPPRMSYRDRRNSEEVSPERDLTYSPRDSPRDASPMRHSSDSRERIHSRNETSRQRSPDSSERQRSRTPDEKTSNEKQSESMTDKSIPAAPNMNMQGGFPDPNFFPGPGFMDKPIPPEDDPYATRTLFVGNLEPDVREFDIRRVFEPFGKIDDIDVKRAARGLGSYCFIRFADLNQAYKAKVSLNGKPVLKNVVRIGYGKLMVSSKIWVGGLGSWTTHADLEREFDRFGAIRRIDYHKGNSTAAILYETIDAAQAACNQMRGFLMPNAETRLRIDFLDPEPGMPGYEGFLEFGRHDSKKSYDNNSQGQSNDRYANNKYKNSDRYRGRNVFAEDRKSDRRRKSRSRSKGRRSHKNDGNSTIKETAMTEMQIKHFHAKSCYTLHDLCQVFDPPCWQGGFVLKKIAFPVLFFLLDGDMGVFNTTTADPNSPTGRQTMFHVTQRLRLNDDKVKEVSKRMKYCEKKTCLVVAVPGVPENLNMSGNFNGPAPTQHKPLRGLVKYFKDKEAAAIVSVPVLTLNSSKDKEGEKDKEKPKEKSVSGVLHCFPPGPFATEQLLRIGPSLQPQFFADDYLVILLVKGSSSALL
ncbi:RNA-binding protein spenito-like [Clavelina lepadiformis]|uniref:Uncharacterized protein n=1 Tax=Clavelina lepadiformis TaxID=159417 RepID=A0ABP0H2P0_CLALP